MEGGEEEWIGGWVGNTWQAVADSLLAALGDPALMAQWPTLGSLCLQPTDFGLFCTLALLEGSVFIVHRPLILLWLL